MITDPEPDGSIAGNPAIEDAAIAIVIECERREGRDATDTRGRGPGDIESGGRVIEVKAFGGRWKSGLLYFTPPQIAEGQANPDYYVHIVENVMQGDMLQFEGVVLHGDDLRRLFAEAKVHRLYVPVHAADKRRLPRIPKLALAPQDDDEILAADEPSGAQQGVTAWRGYGLLSARAADPSRRDKLCQQFLSSVLAEAKERKPDLTRASRIPAKTYYYIAAGRTGFLFGIRFTRQGLQVELYINPKPRELNKAVFDALYELRAEIEAAIGDGLEWERLDHQEGSQIIARRVGATVDDPAEEVDEVREWAVATLVRFAEVFRPLIRDLGELR